MSAGYHNRPGLWLLAAGVLWLVSSPARAADCFATADGNWSNPAIWSCGRVPSAAFNDWAWITGPLGGPPGNRTVTIPSGFDAEALFVIVGDESSGRQRNNTLIFADSTSTLTVVDAYVDRPAGNGNNNLLALGDGTLTVLRDVWHWNPNGNDGGTTSRITIANGTLDIAADLRSDDPEGTVAAHAIDMSGGAGNLFLGGAYNAPADFHTLIPGTASTFHYDGGGQTVLIGRNNINYHHLTLAGGSTKTPTADAAATITGNFTLDTGTTWDGAVNNPILNLQGDFTNGGSFASGTGLYTFDGAAQQTLTGDTTFTNLALNNAAGLLANGNISVATQLDLTDGVITTNANRVIVLPAGNVVRTSGHVNGNLQKPIPTGANVTVTYEIGGPSNYRPAVLDFATVSTAGDVTARVNAGDHPQLANSDIHPALSVNQYWTLTDSGTVFSTYDATFNFIGTDVDTGANTADFVVRRYDAGADTWSDTTTGALTATSSQATGLAEFGDFAVGEELQLDHFAIDVGGGTASTCVPLQVNISARDVPDAVVNDYAGTIVIATSSGHGDWSVVTANGVFDNGIADDGVAGYTFDLADGGAISLNLANMHADDLTVSVTDTALAITTVSNPVGFRDNAFVIIPTDALGTTAAAGRPHAYLAQLMRRDSLTGDCAVATNYAGNFALKAWISRSASDPGGTAPGIGGTALPSALPGANNLSLNFTAGEAAFDLDTGDVGQYGLNFRDDTSGFALDTTGTARAIDGSSSTLTVRPFGLALTDINAAGAPNPGADTPGGGVFAAAGDDFAATVTAVAWQAGDDGDDDGVPDSGANLADNAATPSYAWATTLSAVAPFEPAAGVLGSLANGALGAGSFSSGASTPTNLRYSEVGSVTLTADAVNYLGAAGANITGLSGPVGRFTPDHFDVTPNSTPTFAAACGMNFSYLDQALAYDTAPEVTITARAVGGATTQNYTDIWWKLDNIAPAYSDAGMSAGVTLDSSAATHGSTAAGTNGQVVSTFGGTLSYVRPGGGPPALDAEPFNSNIEVSFDVTDSDGVAYTGNPFAFNIDFRVGDFPAIRHGRLLLTSVVGSELLPLQVPLQAQYYLGAAEGWQVNTDDACTTPATGDFTLTPGTLSSVGSVSFSAGTGYVELAAPGAGNTGTEDVTGTGTDAWLQYDWDGDGSHDNNPAARATFGLYQGNERVIYIRENF